ncbi:MAG: Na/Pi cotransporter family protein [Pseudomonadota bacterium]
MFLLFSVRMVQTGIERIYGSSYSRMISKESDFAKSVAFGGVLAILLQSSAAVALLIAGFSSFGALSFSSGLAMLIGADIGSAVLIRILSIELTWLSPFLMAVGGVLFIKFENQRLRQIGRTILGVAFILLSLRLLRETMLPLQDAAFFPAISDYLARDFVVAFLAGAILAIILHSAVATILMCVTLVEVGALPTLTGITVVLGANLGSGVIPVWLTRGMVPKAQRPLIANLVVRGSGSVAAAIIIDRWYFWLPFDLTTSVEPIIITHIAFNACLIIALSFCSPLETLANLLAPESRRNQNEEQLAGEVSIGDGDLASPQLALGVLRRAVLKMANILEAMTVPVMKLYDSSEKTRTERLLEMDTRLKQALDDVRQFGSEIKSMQTTKRNQKSVENLIEYAIALEFAGAIVVKSLVPCALEKNKHRIEFSREGQEELTEIHDHVVRSIRLAYNVLASDDLESARLLVIEKTEMRRLERVSRKKHLRRLSNGIGITFKSSNIHLETIRSLKDLNSQIVSLAYPLLYREGQLLETRLVTDLTHEKLAVRGSKN